MSKKVYFYHLTLVVRVTVRPK